MLTFKIKGFDPVAETVEAAVHYGAYLGQTITCHGNGHTWFYIFTGDSVRKPNELETYLFRQVIL